MTTSKIIAIAAITTDGILAIDGKMPWHVPEDLKRFKRLTINNTVIMGRVTWESFGCQALPNRVNYVVSRTAGPALIKDTPAKLFRHLDHAVDDARLWAPDRDVYIIGGALVYSRMLPLCDELELTVINEDQVTRTNGEKTYLKEYPRLIDTWFELRNVERTEYAAYKSYTRRPTYHRNKDRTVYP